MDMRENRGKRPGKKRSGPRSGPTPPGRSRTRTNTRSRPRGRTPSAARPRPAPSAPPPDALVDYTTGVLRLNGRDRGELVDPAELYPSPHRVQVGPALIRGQRLVQGCTLAGAVQLSGHQLELTGIDTISRMSPEDYARRGSFKELVPIDPNERVPLSVTGNMSMRIVDLVAPIGKGTRAMIVSPPKAGKTLMLEAMAHSFKAACPNMRVIALLVDERPEEVTHFRRQVDIEVFARTNDQSPQEQVDLVNLVLDMVRVELECGHDITLLVDSLTRVGRAFNVIGSGTRRTMSGGVEAGALEIPRRLFGLARNIEGGGSVTIVATALVDTGSQMDQLIFQEFKGTGNSEIVLDRRLAEQRIFPAINVLASGTRKEERLYGEEDIQRIALLRRGLADRHPREAIEMMLKLMERHANNEELLASIPTS